MNSKDGPHLSSLVSICRGCLRVWRSIWYELNYTTVGPCGLLRADLHSMAFSAKMFLSLVYSDNYLPDGFRVGGVFVCPVTEQMNYYMRLFIRLPMYCNFSR